MYSDPYRGSYHLRSLTEAEILSSRHYRGMTSAPRHGSNYIIQACNTPASAAASEAPPLCSSSCRSFCTPAIYVLHSASPSILFFFFSTPTPTRHHHSVWSLCRTGARLPSSPKKKNPQPSALKDNTTEYNHFDCLGDFSQRVLRCRTFWQVGGGARASPHTPNVLHNRRGTAGVDFRPPSAWSTKPRG